VPSGVIKTDKEINKDNFQEVKERIRTQYEGKKNAFKLMFLTHGFDYQQVSLSQRDMQYIDKRKLSRDQILSIFKVPKSLVAVSDQVNRATSETEYTAFAENVIKPRLDLIFDKLNKFYLPLFPNTENYELRFTNPVPDDKEYKLKERQASVGVWRTPNEIRAEDGLEPIEGGDTLYQVNNYNYPIPADNNDNNGDENKHLHKEALPNPSKISNRKQHNYTARRNKYLMFKQNQLELKLLQHFNYFIRDLKREPIKKAISFAEEELTAPEIEQNILPPKEDITRWKFMLYLLLYTKLLETSETCRKQLLDIYEFKDIPDETSQRMIEHRAVQVSDGISKTMLNKVKDVVKRSVDNGITDIKDIKKEVVKVLSDQKDWKVEQIARTELVNAYEETQHKVYTENKVETVKWICGSSPCGICDKNRDVIQPIGRAFPSGHSRPGETHPSCVCEIVPIV